MGGGTLKLWKTEKRPRVPKLPTLFDESENDETYVAEDTNNGTDAGGVTFEGSENVRLENNQLRKCDCCGNLTIPQNSRFAICSLCSWQDDPEQKANPYLKNRSNKMSLYEARKALAEGREIN